MVPPFRVLKGAIIRQYEPGFLAQKLSPSGADPPAIGLAGALPGAAFQTPSSIPYRTLGKTGLKVCPVGFGTGFTPEPTVIARAVDLGVNYFDTASDYANGNSERLVTRGSKVCRGTR